MSAPHSTTEAIYDTETKMYAMYVNGELVGFAWDIAEARATLSEFDAPRYELLLDCAGPDVPLDGPSVEEEGGEGGEPPPDDFTGHLHFIIGEDGKTLPLAAAPDSPAPSPLQPAPAGGEAANAAGPCDVSGCAAPGSTVWLGRWPAYPARLCGAHRKAVA